MQSTLLTSLTVFAIASARTFTVVNQCQQTVWFGFVSGYGSPTITPPNNNFELSSNGGRTVVDIPTSGWSGVIAGRTNCSDSGCVTADCGGGKGACVHGFQQPATQAEFTVNNGGTDFYDVEVINGVNLPVSITPSVSSTSDNHIGVEALVRRERLLVLAIAVGISNHLSVNIIGLRMEVIVANLTMIVVRGRSVV